MSITFDEIVAVLKLDVSFLFGLLIAEGFAVVAFGVAPDDAGVWPAGRINDESRPKALFSFAITVNKSLNKYR